jgi:hypothetical protein
MKFREVKLEIRDESQILSKSSNGQYELFLLTTEGSSNSDGTNPFKLTTNNYQVNK